MNNLLEIKNLTLIDTLSNKKILRNFNISLKMGSIHSLVGASGSGKSTLAFCILNLLPPSFLIQYDLFEIFSVNFQTIQNWRALRGSSIVYIPQNPADSFHPYFKLKTQIEDYFTEKDLYYNEKEVITYMSKLGIKDSEKKLQLSPFSLSGGERQRVLIAISSMINPKLILADEPTTALDSVNERLVLKDLVQLNRKCGTTILLVTHDRRIVRELADEVTVLNHGKIMDQFQMSENNFPKELSKYSQNLLLEKNETK